MKKFQKVLDFATEKHKGQVRKNTGEAYINHCIAVAEMAVKLARQNNSFSEKEIEMIYCIGLTHDVVEDQNVTWQELDALLISTEEFTDYEAAKVRDSVFDLTRLSKESFVLRYLAGIKNNRLATIVKLADLEHNLSDLKAGNLRDKYHLCKWYLEH